METAIAKAARIAGNRSILANLLGVSPQAVQQWIEKGKPPADRCRAIENAVNRAVTRFELRPDVFGDADESPSLPTSASISP